MSRPLSDLPSVRRVLEDDRLAHLPRRVATPAVRAELESLRAAMRAGRLEGGGDLAEVAARGAARRAERLLAPAPRRVHNATGVVVHTNLGRAPLAPGIAALLGEVAASYVDLEMDLDTGRRSDRLVHVRERLCLLAGAEDALVVNNNAAAVLLALTALARGREAVVSRGELVEIGGSFRLPDVMRLSGVWMREVGTTNRTRVADYREAIGERTALLVRVHPSNFRLEGFTHRPTTAELARLGPPLLEDLGSGVLGPDIADEPTPVEAIRAGAALVTFSGDKLLGGPQAGILCGRRELVERCRRHPLYRALRADKLQLAALAATLAAYLREDQRSLPVRWMLSEEAPARAARRELAEALARALADRLPWPVEARVVEDAGGGGALPGVRLPGWAVAIAAAHPDRLSAALRRGAPPVVGRVHGEVLLLHARTLLLHPGQDPAATADEVARAVLAAYATLGS